MNTENMLKLANFLDSLSLARPSNEAAPPFIFDLGVWWTNPNPEYSCGTIGCIAGAAQAAKVLRNLAATGAVDWSLAVEKEESV